MEEMLVRLAPSVYNRGTRRFSSLFLGCIGTQSTDRSCKLRSRRDAIALGSSSMCAAAKPGGAAGGRGNCKPGSRPRVEPTRAVAETTKFPTIMIPRRYLGVGTSKIPRQRRRFGGVDWGGGLDPAWGDGYDAAKGVIWWS